MEKETKKRKGGTEKERKRKKKKRKLEEIFATCTIIQKTFARASTPTESQTTVNPALLLEHQDQHQSVSYHDVPASDLVNQNYSGISISPVSESEVQTVYTDKPEPDSFSQDNPEECFAPQMQVSEVQQDQSVILSVTAYHSWFVKPKRDKLTKYLPTNYKCVLPT